MSPAEFSIKRPVTTWMVFLALALLGAISYYQLPIALLPDLVFPRLYVMLSLPGASPEKIEREMVLPAEGEIAKLDNVEEIRTQIYSDFARIAVSYHFDTDMRFAYLRLDERMNALKRQFDDFRNINVFKFDTREFFNLFMQLSVVSEEDVDRTRYIADKKIIPRIESVDGVVSAEASGGRNAAVEILIDPYRAQAYGISVPSIYARVQNENQRAAKLGYVIDRDLRYSVEFTGQFHDVQTIRELPIAPSSHVRLRDLGEIRKGHRERTSIFRINGKESVGISLRKDDTANMIRVAEAVEKEVEALNAELAAQGVQIKVTMNHAEEIAKAIRQLKKLALTGVALAAGVLLLFLRSFRLVGVILIAIPVCLLTTFNLMYYQGMTINILSLVGLAVAIGLLMDNSIVAIESIFRHREMGLAPKEAAMVGGRRITRPVMAATLTTVVIFLPGLFLQNEAKIILSDLAFAIVFPLIASVAVALTLIPSLLSRMLNKGTALEKPLRHRVSELYAVSLKATVRHPCVTIVGVFLAFLLTLVITTVVLIKKSQEKKPEDRIEISIEMPTGTTFDTTERTAAGVEEIVTSLKDTRFILSRIDNDDAEITIHFVPEDERKGKLNLGRIKAQLKKDLEGIPGGEYIEVDPKRTGPGGGDGGQAIFGRGGGAAQVNIRGRDMDVILEIAHDIEERLNASLGGELTDARTRTRAVVPQLVMEADREALSTWNLDVSEIMMLIWATRREGQRVTVPFRDGDDEIPIEVRPEGTRRRTPKEVRDYRVPAREGNRTVSLSELAQFRVSDQPHGIDRVNQEREVTVVYSIQPVIASSRQALETVQRQVEEVVASVRLPPGYAIEIEHEAKEAQVRRDFKRVAWQAAILVFMVLAAIFESLAAPVVIMMTIPLAAIGILWALVLTGTPLDTMARLGLILVLGIAVNNGVFLIDEAGYLRRERGYRLARATLEAARVRARPILMTAGTTIVGALPLALGKGGQFDIWTSFGVAMIGGMFVSTALTLIFIPAAYITLDRFIQWLKEIGPKTVLVETIACGAFCRFYLYQQGWIESAIYTILAFLTLWLFVLGATWLVKRLIWPPPKIDLIGDKDIDIELRSLTKVYGEPAKAIRDWNKVHRREERRVNQEIPIISAADQARDLTWKLPLLGLLIYLNLSVESKGWLFFLPFITWVAVTDLIRTGLVIAFRRMSILRYEDLPAKARSAVEWANRALFLPALALSHFRSHEKPGVTIAVVVLCLLFLYTRNLARRRREKKLTVAELHGIRGFLKRLLLAIPLVGEKERVEALLDVNLRLQKGMFGLLGPNGAGKSTLIRIVCNIYDPSRGCVRISGHDLRSEGESLQGAIGYLPQNFGHYDDFTAGEYLRYYALLNGTWDRVEREERVRNVLKLINLEDQIDKRIGTFSGGMKQRVGIARVLLKAPRIVVVDEPTAGLDPAERIRFRNLLSELARDRVVILSTHIAEDIATTCHHLAVLDKGQVLYEGTPESLRELAHGMVWEGVLDEEQLQWIRDNGRIVTQVRVAEGIRVRFLLGERPSVPAQGTTPTLEDAYLALLTRMVSPAPA